MTTLHCSEEGTVTGNAACNSYSAEYRGSGEELVIGSVVSTLMYCADDSTMEQERIFFQLLSQVRSFEIDGDILTLYGSGGRELLVCGKSV